MSRFLQFGAAVVMLTGISSAANAQTASACCGGCSGVQTYQRYSYQPAPFQQPITSGVVTQTYSPVPMQAQGIVVPSQSYRRYSYQPMPRSSGYYSSGRKKAPWEYAKGEPERNRP